MVKTPDATYGWDKDTRFVTLECGNKEIIDFTNFLLKLYEEHIKSLDEVTNHR